MPASAFALEIKVIENATMDDPQRAETLLNSLPQQSFRISLGDFRTGYLSLCCLQCLPVGQLKIEKSFVLGIEPDADDATTVRSILDLAHNLRLSVVGEGIENATVLVLLHALDCDEVQGDPLSRSLPVEAFWAWHAPAA